MERLNNKTRTILEWVLMLGGWFFFEWLLIDMLKIPGSQLLEPYFPIAWVLLTIVAVALSQSWKKKGNWILYAGFLFIVVRCMFGPVEAHDFCYQMIVNAVWAFGVCYHLGSALRKENMMRFLRVLIAGWTIQHTVAAVMGIYCMLFDKVIYNMSGDNLIWYTAGRLHLLVWCTNAASNLVVSVFAAMVGAAITKNKLGRIFYIIAMLIMISVVPLTGTRTAFMTLGIGLGIFFGGWILNKINRKTELQRRGRRAMLKGATAIGALILVAVVCTVMIQGGQLFNAGKDAMVESGGVKVGYRDFSLTKSLLSGREIIWEAGLQMLADNPQYLLYGASFGEHVMVQANAYTLSDPLVHFHSLYIQTLVECGIPGLTLLLGFILYFAKAAYRIYTRKQRWDWACTLPLIPVVALIAEVVESLTLLQYNYPVLPFMMLFMGITIRVAQEQKEVIQEA